MFVKLLIQKKVVCLHHINQNENKMYSNYKMKQAVNKEEAIISILDVVEENPVWLNKITDSLFILVKTIEPKHKRFLLEKSMDEQVIDLFVKLREQEDKFNYDIKRPTVWS